MQLELLTRKILAVVIALGTIVSLSSCQLIMELPSNGPVAIGEVDGYFRVAACASIESTSFSMSQRKQGGSWLVFWENTEPVNLERGQVLSSANHLDLGLDSGREPILTAGDEILIQFVGRDESFNDTVNAGFDIPRNGIGDGKWLQTNGELTSEPCPGA